MSGKKTFQIRQNYPAPMGFFAGAGFLPDLESAGFRPEPKSGTALVLTNAIQIISVLSCIFLEIVLEQMLLPNVA